MPTTTQAVDVGSAQDRVRVAIRELFVAACAAYPAGSLVRVRSDEAEMTLEVLRVFPRRDTPTSPGVGVRVAELHRAGVDPTPPGMQFCTDLESLRRGFVHPNDYRAIDCSEDFGALRLPSGQPQQRARF